MTVTILVLLVVLVVLLTAHTAQAQTEPAPPPPAPAATDDSAWKNVRFGATLEGYYQYHWNRPPDRVLALRAYDTRTNVFGIQQAASSSTPPRTSPPDAATVFAPTCSSARPRKPFRAVRPTNRGPTSTVTCGRSTARTCFQWALACRPISANSRRCSATRPTTRRTIRPFPAPTSSTFCPSTTRVFV